MGFVITSGNRRWRGHKVPFVVDDSIREVPVDFGAVNLAIEVWNANTCIPFTPKTDLDTDFVEFIRHDQGCRSPIGRQGGRQQIKCDFVSQASSPFLDKARLTLHEMAHAVGLLHEHQRPDRDRYTLVSANALRVDSDQFQILDDDDVSAGAKPIGAYDCASITHYQQLTGLIAPHPDGCGTIGIDGPQLTEGDVNAVAHLYAYIRRRDSGDEQIGVVGEVAAANFRNRELVTAIRGESGKLRLFSWSVDSLGRLSKLGDSNDPVEQAGIASSIDIARVDNRFVVACRTNEGRLRLISWEVRVDGADRIIRRRGDSANLAGEASLIQVAAIPESRLCVTACRTDEGNLKLIGWRINDDSVDRIAESDEDDAGEVDDVALAVLGSSPVTAVRSANGKLKLIGWRWDTGDPPSDLIERRGQSKDDVGDASLIRAVTIGNRLFVSFRTSNDRLRLTTWRFTLGAAGFILMGDSHNQAGEIEGNALAVQDDRTLVSAVRTDENRLRLIQWTLDNRGGIARTGDSGDEGGDVTSVLALSPLPLRLAPFPPFDAPFIVSCGRRTSQRLELISWTPVDAVDRNAPEQEPELVQPAGVPAWV